MDWLLVAVLMAGKVGISVSKGLGLTRTDRVDDLVHIDIIFSNSPKRLDFFRANFLFFH